MTIKYISQNKEKKWSVSNSKTGKSIKIFDTQKEAIAHAKKTKDLGSLMVKDKSGWKETTLKKDSISKAKAPAKKTAAKAKPTTKPTSNAKKEAPKKDVVKKATPKKAVVKKEAVKKTVAKKASPKKAPIKKEANKKDVVKKHSISKKSKIEKSSKVISPIEDEPKKDKELEVSPEIISEKKLPSKAEIKKEAKKQKALEKELKIEKAIEDKKIETEDAVDLGVTSTMVADSNETNNRINSMTTKTIDIKQLPSKQSSIINKPSPWAVGILIFSVIFVLATIFTIAWFLVI